MWDMEKGMENCVGGFRERLGRHLNQNNKMNRAKEEGWIQKNC